MKLYWRKHPFIAITLVAVLMGLAESVLQYMDTRYVRSIAWDVVQMAQASDPRSRVIALRDFLRSHVTFQGFSQDGRPFLRASAADTLRSGKGYCGEVTRAFICMAATLGIRAQRINLYGKSAHVVAEAELAPGDRVLVDCQNPPQIAGLEKLDRVILRDEYDDYYTLNLRRLGINWLVTRIKLEMGPLTYLTENPHTLKALLWFMFALALLTFKEARILVRVYLRKRGWIHISEVPAITMAAVAGSKARQTASELGLQPVIGASSISDLAFATGLAGREVYRDNEINVFQNTRETLAELRCPGCGSELLLNGVDSRSDDESSLYCSQCLQIFPIIDNIPRMLLPPMREAIFGRTIKGDVNPRQVAAARSFEFEWSRFPEMYGEWESNFLEYVFPHGPDFFRGKRVLDVGCGNGRHAYYAAKFGAEVWAIDLGKTVEVARRNTAECKSIHVVQADLHHLPFAPESFDFIYLIGVLHHLPDPEAAFRNLLRFLKPGGEILIYLYWRPEGQPLKRALLGAVTAVRQITTRLPHRIVYALSFPAAFAAYALFVWPYQLLCRVHITRRLAEQMPMKQYARYPFRVCVNDQFDRFSAPIENRYTRAEVEAWLKRAGLEDINIRPNYGWVGSSGRKPFVVARSVCPGLH